MTHLEKTSAPVKTLLLICEKCGKKQIAEGQDNPSSLLQKNIKSRIKQELPVGTARAITTSCLSICPSNAITVVRLSPLSPHTDTQFYILHKQDIAKATDVIFKELLSL